MTGRLEKPVDTTVPACADLANFLRDRKRKAGMTYEQIALKTGRLPSAATLKRAASGTSVPAWETVRKYVEATTTAKEVANGNIDLTLKRAYRLQMCARRATRAPYYVHKEPDPRLISDTADLSRALRDLHAWSGAPSTRNMSARAPIGLLPQSTARRIIKGQAVPVNLEQAIAFVTGCFLVDLAPWLDAFARVMNWSDQFEFAS